MPSEQRRPVGWPGALDEYLTAMRAAGRAPGTLKLHRHYLGLLAEQHRSPWRVTFQQLIAFQATEGWKPETRKSARTVVRGFYRWAHGSGYLPDDPAFALPTVTVPPGTPKPTPEHLVRQLLRDESERIVHMAKLAAFNGLRVSEIAQVHADDLIGDVLIVHGKGGKERIAVIVDQELLAWLTGLTGWAFPNGRGGHLTAGHVSRLLSRALPAPWTGHKLRHRMGTIGHRRTRNLLAARDALGHARLETTQVYVLSDSADLRAFFEATSIAS